MVQASHCLFRTLHQKHNLRGCGSNSGSGWSGCAGRSGSLIYFIVWIYKKIHDCLLWQFARESRKNNNFDHQACSLWDWTQQKYFLWRVKGRYASCFGGSGRSSPGGSVFDRFKNESWKWWWKQSDLAGYPWQNKTVVADVDEFVDIADTYFIPFELNMFLQYRPNHVKISLFM